MSDPTPDPLPAAVRAVMAERAAKRREAERVARKAEAKDQALVAAATAEPGARHGNTSLPDQVTRITHVVRKTYLALLCEKEVVESVRAVLTSKDARAVTNMIGGLKDLLAADGVGAGAPLGGVRVSVINRIPRPAGSPVVDVTPRKDVADAG